MKNKKQLIISTGIFVVIGILGIGTQYRNNLVERNKKLKISNTAIEYLMSKETFKDQVFEETDAKYNKDIEMYVVSVKFQNNSKKAIVIVSASNEIINNIQLK